MIWIVGFFIVAVIAIFFRILWMRQIEVEKNHQDRYSEETIVYMDKYAYYIAKKSDGYSHTRGNGFLVLVNDELHFDSVISKNMISIPTSMIRNVGKTKRLAGQGFVKPKLLVEFVNQDGSEDAIIWHVKRLDTWIDKISVVIKEARERC